jgi:hypothetical protein
LLSISHRDTNETENPEMHEIIDTIVMVLAGDWAALQEHNSLHPPCPRVCHRDSLTNPKWILARTSRPCS